MTEKKPTSKEKVIAALQEKPLNWIDLWASTGLKQTTLNKAISKLIVDKKIEAVPNEENEVLLQLTNPPK